MPCGGIAPRVIVLNWHVRLLFWLGSVGPFGAARPTCVSVSPWLRVLVLLGSCWRVFLLQLRSLPWVVAFLVRGCFLLAVVLACLPVMLWVAGWLVFCVRLILFRNPLPAGVEFSSGSACWPRSRSEVSGRAWPLLRLHLHVHSKSCFVARPATSEDVVARTNKASWSPDVLAIERLPSAILGVVTRLSTSCFE